MAMLNITDVPVVPGGGFFGHANQFQHHSFEFLQSIAATGPVSRILFGKRTVLFANTAETAHEILVEQAKSFEKSPGLRIVLSDLAGKGLFTSEGELWKQQRRLMSPMFQREHLLGFAPTMNDEAHRALARWKKQPGTPIEISTEMTRIAMNVVGRAVFDIDSLHESDAVGEALRICLDQVNAYSGSPIMILQLTLLEKLEREKHRLPSAWAPMVQATEDLLQSAKFFPARYVPRVRKAVETINKYMIGEIEARKQSRAQSTDLLARLLAAKESDDLQHGMSEQQVRDEAITLFVAGHETTANTLSWCFYLLAKHPDVLAKLREEAQAFGPSGPTQYDAEKLSYATRVFKEVLRLYPPVVYYARRSSGPVHVGPYALPKQTLCFVSPYAVHLDPKYWPDPLKFDPDRFTPELEAARHRSAWIPFGTGPRVCIGNFFAMMEGPIVLATLLANADFDINPALNIGPGPSATLAPGGEINATVRFR